MVFQFPPISAKNMCFEQDFRASYPQKIQPTDLHAAERFPVSEKKTMNATRKAETKKDQPDLHLCKYPTKSISRSRCTYICKSRMKLTAVSGQQAALHSPAHQRGKTPFSKLVVWLRRQRRWQLLAQLLLNEEPGDGNGVMSRLLRDAARKRRIKISPEERAFGI